MRSCALALVTTLITFALAVCHATELTAGGLSTNLGEVVIAGLEKGEKYSLKAMANVLLSVVNRGEDTATVRVCVLVPDSVELRQGAEPIPCTDWVSLERDSFVLAPGRMGVSDVFIEIPNDTAVAGKKFQVMLWSRTIPGPGVFIACGLKSRIIFSIADAGNTNETGRTDDARSIDDASSTKNKNEDARAGSGREGKTRRSLESR